MKFFRWKSRLNDKWKHKINKPNHAVQIAIVALLLTAMSFTFNIYSNLDKEHNGETLYLKQISREVWSNLDQIEHYEKQTGDGVIKIPIYPYMAVYEAGLQNGMIVKLPPSTQNSLFTAYTYSQRVIQQSLGFSFENYSTNAFKVRSAIIGSYIEAVKINLEGAQERGLYIADSNGFNRGLQAILSVVFFVIIILQIARWALLSIRTR